MSVPERVVIGDAEVSQGDTCTILPTLPATQLALVGKDT